MDGAEPPSGPDDRADHERNAVTLLGQEPVLRRLVDQAVHREREKVSEHDLEHGSHPRDRRAVGGAGHRQLGDRRVEDALGAVLLVQAGRDREDATGERDVFAEQDHALVARELLVERVVNSLPELHLSHW